MLVLLTVMKGDANCISVTVMEGDFMPYQYDLCHKVPQAVIV